MSHNQTEILVVDDDLDAAKSFAELISQDTGLGSVAVSVPADAIDLIRKGGIKVAVLDERMPEKSGTDLYTIIHQTNPFVKALMLTGEADRNEVAKALRMGYVSVLDKKDVSKLPSEVIKAYTTYQIDLGKKHILSNPYHIKVLNPLKNRFWTQRFDICSIKEVNKEYTFDDKWKCTLEITESQKDVEENIEYKDSLVIENGTESKSNILLKGILGLPSFTSEINNAITETYKTTYSQTNSISKRAKRTYILNDGNDKKTAVKKVYERNRVYAEYDILIKKTCKICGSITLFSIKAYKSLPKEDTRITIYYTDKSKSLIETGIVSI